MWAPNPLVPMKIQSVRDDSERSGRKSGRE
jgi:hypothetical protein